MIFPAVATVLGLSTSTLWFAFVLLASVGIVLFLARHGGGSGRPKAAPTARPVATDRARASRQHVCEASCGTAKSDFIQVWEFDAHGAYVVATAPSAAARPVIPGMDRPGDDDASLHVARRRLKSATGARSIEIFPVHDEGRVVGLLVVGWRRHHPPLDEAQKRLLSLLADHLALASERTRLERSARTDDLTGLPNRSALEAELRREMARSARLGVPLALALVDLDDFKILNDTKGHLAGDAALRSAATLWRTHLRDSDLLARLGGDEFAVLLPACPLDEARDVVERMAQQTPEGVSCSVGVTAWTPGEDPDTLVDRADRALYAAKAAGRSRTVAFPDARQRAVTPA